MEPPTLEAECPNCFRKGIVLVERVIRAGEVYRSLRCDACGYEWTKPSDDPNTSDDHTDQS